MIEKLKDIERKFNEIEEKLSDPAIISNMEEYKKYTKEYKNLSPVVEKYREYVSHLRDKEDGEEVLAEGDEDMRDLAEEQIKSAKENMEKYDAEITALGERIVKYCPDITIRLTATARLAFNHVLHGRREIGRSIYETLPSMELCKERQILWALEKYEELPFLRNSIKQSYELLKSLIY